MLTTGAGRWGTAAEIPATTAAEMAARVAGSRAIGGGGRKNGGATGVPGVIGVPGGVPPGVVPASEAMVYWLNVVAGIGIWS